MKKLTFLGTGHGMPIASSCSCMLLEDNKNNLLFDTGGGHDILVRFTQANKKPTLLQNIFISHYDSDHILGFIPIVRALHRWNPRPTEKIKIFCSSDVKKSLDSMFEYVAQKHWKPVQDVLEFKIIKDGETHKTGDWNLQFFDLKSNGSPQLGCTVTFSDGKKLAFLGDEPFREQYKKIVLNPDILVHNAFCLDDQEKIFKAHEKNHSTVKEAAQNATKIGAKTLVLLHMEDKTLETRKKKYKTEAEKYFSGKIVVPLDLDSFQF